MTRARAKGIKIGRPRPGIEVRQKIAQRAAKGETPYAIAKGLGSRSKIRWLSKRGVDGCPRSHPTSKPPQTEREGRVVPAL
jgi:hypothetical protein